MKRLLLLFLLAPVILLAQTQRKQVIDTNKEAPAFDIQSIFGVIGNNPCTRVANIRINHNTTDSGEYITTVVFFHILSVSDSANIDTINAIPTLDISIINIESIPAGNVEIATNIPPLPIPDVGIIPPLLPIAVFKMSTDEIPVGNPEIVTDIPPLPLVIPELFKSLPPIAVSKMVTEVIPLGNTDIVTNIPPLPIFIDTLGAAPLLAALNMTTERISAGKVDIVTSLPPLPAVKEDSIEALLPITGNYLATGDIPLGKMDIVTNLPKFEEEKTPVTEMHLSPEGYSLLEKLEGYSPGLYTLNDGGYTIGFGFFVPFNEGYKWKNGVTWEDAERIIQEKVPAYEDQVKKFVNVPLTQREFDALTMLAYNLGGFSKATSIINDVNNMVDFDKLQADWKRFIHSKAPNVSKGLMNRRKDELEVRRTSDYQPDRKIQIFKSRK